MGLELKPGINSPNPSAPDPPYSLPLQVNECRTRGAPRCEQVSHPRLSSRGMAEVQDGHRDTCGRWVHSSSEMKK